MVGESERRSRLAKRNLEDIGQIGKVGRKTGLTVPEQRRDSGGFEDMSGFFDPTTTAKKAKAMEMLSASVYESATRSHSSLKDMDLETSSAPNPQFHLSARKSVSRAKTPTKTHIQSPALRLNSATGQFESPRRLESVRARESEEEQLRTAKIARKLVFPEREFQNAVRQSASEDDDSDRAHFQNHVLQDQEDYDDDGFHSTGDAGLDDMNDDGLDGASASSQGKEDDEHVEANVGSEVDVEPRNKVLIEQVREARERDTDEPGGPEYQTVFASPLAGAGALENADPAEKPNKSNGRKKRAGKPTIRHSESDRSFDEDEHDSADLQQELRDAPMKKNRRTRTLLVDSGQEAVQKDHEQQSVVKKKRKQTMPKAVSQSLISPSRARPVSQRAQSPQRVWREPIVNRKEDSVEVDGRRRSTRTRVAPLAFWKGEKMVWGRGSHRNVGQGKGLGIILPEIQEIIHVEDANVPTAKHRARSRRTKKVKKEVEESSSGEEDEWEDSVIVEAAVNSHLYPGEMERMQLAIPGQLYSTRPVAGQSILFQRTLCDDPYSSTGILDLPVGGEKPTKPSKLTTIYLVVLYGYVEVRINDTHFRLKTTGQFKVPRSNFYSIKNVGNRDARLFFCMCIDTKHNEEREAQKQQMAQT